MTKCLAVIDGKSVFYRGYYAMPGLTTKDGTPTGGVFGFASLAIELIKKIEPDYVAVAWDKSKTNIRARRKIYPEYKAGRKSAPPDFYEQIPILQELLEAFGWPLYELDDYEADDILGAFANQASARGIETCLITSDLDALQLINSQTKVYALKNGLSNLEEFDVASFEQKYGIRTDQFLDYKALKGDSSDNLPGVPGIGAKTATKLLQEFDNLQNIYKNLDKIKPSIVNKLTAGREMAFLTKKVATLWTDAPVELDWEIADVDDTDIEQVAQILKRLEFNSLVRRLPKYMQSTPEQGSLFFELAHQASVKLQAWPEQINLNGQAVALISDDKLWLSPDKTTVFCQPVNQVERSVWRALEFVKVINYDVKNFYHQLASFDINLLLNTVHDVRQAAFLIDPLRRDRSLSGLIGAELNTVEQEVSALWQIYAWQQEAFRVQPQVAKIAEQFDFPVIHTLFLMEQCGIKIDQKQLQVMNQKLTDELRQIEQQIYAQVGYQFNVASPAQLSQILFTKLQLPTSGIKKGKKTYSTDQKTLDKLRGTHPIIELIENYRELAKLKSTYLDALPKLADAQSLVHTTFAQDMTSTGRLSSQNPNLQNIPIRSQLGRKIRDAFVPRSGKLFVSADYSQFELRLAAILANDKQLIEDFNSDVDIHTKTASQVYKIAPEKVTKNQRRDAKVINFGVLYGMSPHGLSAATGMSFEQSKQFIDQYFVLRAPIRNFIDETLNQARQQGFVETFFGRRRPTPDLMSSNYLVRSAAERAAANMPIQGTEADLMKRAMIEVSRQLGSKANQILQIHDSILLECDQSEAELVAAQLRQIMENIAPELAIKLKVDVSIGRNWGEL